MSTSKMNAEVKFKPDTLDASYIKWISRQMEKRVLEYSDSVPLNIFCGTWNVNAKVLPESCDLREWILSVDAPVADLYIIGLQEIVDLNVMNVVLNSRSSDEMSAYWIQKVSNALNKSTEKYSLLTEKHMVGIEFMVFVKDSLLPHVRDVRTGVTFTGGRGLMGNKGGIATRLDLFDSSICFVCAHFHADRDNVTARNNDYQTIVDSTVLLPNSSSSGAAGDSGRQKSQDGGDEDNYSKHKDVALSILNHEQVFWLGDLNYRISEDMDTSLVFDAVLGGEWFDLRSKDQLNLERAKNNVFQGFEEGALTFPPTYKYQPGTDVYETRAEKKLRAPAWCDRVLWRSANKEAVKLLNYRRAALNPSDHKPVSAVFRSDLRKVIPAKMKAIYQELLFSVDKWVNASAPKISVEGRIIDVGTMTCRDKFKSKLVLSNIGSVMAEWQFVPKNDELLVCKSWIKLSPMDGILAPGEVSEVDVTVDLSPEAVFQIANTPKDSDNNVLDDIFVLRAVKGSDFFCIVSGLIDLQTVAEVRQAFSTRKAESRPSVTPGGLNPKQLVSKTSFFSKEQQTGGASIPSTTTAADEDEDDEDNNEMNIEQIYGTDKDTI